MRRLALILLLAGCAATPRAQAPAPGGTAPVRAIAYRDTVTVEFADGTLCAAQRPPSRPAAWSGTLSGCPHLLGYAVDLPSGWRGPRLMMTPGSAAPPSLRVTLANGRAVAFGAAPGT